MIRWLEAPADDARFTEARALFPSCYSNEFDLCIDKGTGTYPDCKRLLELWGTDKNDPVSLRLQAEVAKLPYCSAASRPISPVLLIVGGIVIGAIAAAVLA